MIVIRGLAFIALLAMAGCGQRGELYLPDKQAAQVEAPAQSQPKDEPKKKDE